MRTDLSRRAHVDRLSKVITGEPAQDVIWNVRFRGIIRRGLGMADDKERMSVHKNAVTRANPGEVPDRAPIKMHGDIITKHPQPITVPRGGQRCVRGVDRCKLRRS